jgi:hypothetical protein
MDLTMMERVGDRRGKMEGYCSTGQSPQWAVVPVEEEEEDYDVMYTLCDSIMYVHIECTSLQLTLAGRWFCRNRNL